MSIQHRFCLPPVWHAWGVPFTPCAYQASSNANTDCRERRKIKNKKSLEGHGVELPPASSCERFGSLAVVRSLEKRLRNETLDMPIVEFLA